VLSGRTRPRAATPSGTIWARRPRSGTSSTRP